MTTRILATYEPQTIPSGGWPETIANGAWWFEFVPDHDSGSQSATFNVLFWIQDGANETAVFVHESGFIAAQHAGVQLDAIVLSYSSGQTMRLDVDLASGTITLSGASSGNGDMTFSPVSVATTGTLYVGKHSGGTLVYEGSIGDFYSEAAPTTTPPCGAFVSPSTRSDPRFVRFADSSSRPDSGAIVGLTGFDGDDDFGG